MQRTIKNKRLFSATLVMAFSLGLLAAGCASRPLVGRDGGPSAGDGAAARAISESTPPAPSPPKRADFGAEDKSPAARRIADWVVDLGDNRGLPFAIVDKTDAKVFVFSAEGKLVGAAPVLLGIARGDDSRAGIGERKLSEIPPKDRTTPAGRFLASLGHNSHGKDILWVDYENAISLHRVVTNNPKERRLERLASPTPSDNRISFGCINVPAQFFDDVVRTTFDGTYGVVYVLPEVRHYSEIFNSYYDVE